jgi:broad specificity phosphatase PhoE
MLRLYLLAHAPTGAQRQYRFAADEGILPISATLIERVRDRVGVCDAALRGPERRAAETAAALSVTASPCDGLRAWSTGSWSGRSLSWVAEHEPEAFNAWQTDPNAAPGGGETLNALLARVAQWTDAQASISGRVLVIADPAVIRGVVVHVLGAPPASFWRFDIAPFSVSVVQHAVGQWRLRCLGLDPSDPIHSAGPRLEQSHTRDGVPGEVR